MKRLGGEIMDARIYWTRPIYLAMDENVTGAMRVEILVPSLWTASVTNTNRGVKDCIGSDLVDSIAFPGWEDSL